MWILFLFVLAESSNDPKASITRNCKDGSDENQHECEGPSCSLDQFTCILYAMNDPTNSPKCISSNKVCDDNIDCEDGSDEENAMCGKPCEYGDFTCDFYNITDLHNNPKCIPVKKVCNGRIDCKDGSDEEHAMCGKHCAYG